MKIIKTLSNKPWLDEQVVIDEELNVEAAVIALRVFMVVVGVLFFLFIVAYHMRMALPDWSSMPKPWQLWINTTILIFSSVALQLASNAAKAQQWKSMRIHLLMGGFLAISFLLGQLYSWQLLNEAGYFVASNPANSFFYLFTALHGVHLLGGLVAWSKPMLRLYRKGEIDTMQQRALQLNTTLCANYWHFLLATWFVLFGLLLAT